MIWNYIIKLFKSSNSDNSDKDKVLSKNSKNIRIISNGFELYNADSLETYNFDDIESIFAFKVDLYVIDSICLEFIFKDETHIRCNEDQKGWDELMEKIGSSFKLLDESWYFTVMQPPFETNLTLIFDRQNRSFEEVLSKNFR